MIKRDKRCRVIPILGAVGFLWFPSAVVGQGYIQANGRDLVYTVSQQNLCLRGVGFATDLLRDPNDPAADWERNSPGDNWIPVTDWYSESDVQSLAGFGFNMLRIALNYRMFEDDGDPCTCNLLNEECANIFSFPAGDACNYVNSVWSQDPSYSSGWHYLDTWIQWAKNHGVTIVFDMHTPQGGLQLSAPGVLLWTDSQRSDRLVRLWRAIAKRYANESVVAAFDMLNEPSPAEPGPQVSTGQLWQTLAGRIIAEIRKEDTQHLIIMERVIAITDENFNFAYDEYTLPMANSWFLMGDSNVMYDFHYYWPMINHQPNWGLCGGTINYPAPSILEDSFQGQPQIPCDYNGVESHFQAFNDFGVTNQVPTSVTEWGGASLGGDIFSYVGGLQYIQDMLSILEGNHANSAFFYTNILHQNSDQAQPFDPTRTSIFSNYFQGATCVALNPTATATPTQTSLATWNATMTPTATASATGKPGTSTPVSGTATPSLSPTATSTAPAGLSPTATLAFGTPSSTATKSPSSPPTPSPLQASSSNEGNQWLLVGLVGLLFLMIRIQEFKVP